MKELKLLEQSKHTLAKPAIVLRDLWKGLELVDKYGDWSKTWLSKFEQDIDFTIIRLEPNNPNGGRPPEDHAVTIETAKHIALMSDTAKGKEYRTQR